MKIIDRRSSRKFSSDFNSKVVLEVWCERSRKEELAQKYELHPTQINQCKKEERGSRAVRQATDCLHRSGQPVQQ